MTDFHEQMLCLQIILNIFITSACGLMCGNRCCANFYQHKNGSCLDCPLGTFGLNCSVLCKEGFYGRLCRSKCNCANEDCDKEFGCKKKEIVDQQATSRLSERTQERTSCAACNCLSPLCHQPTENIKDLKTTDTMKDKSVWENVSFALIGSIITVIVAVGLVLLSARLRKPRDDKHHNNTPVDESTSEDVQQLEPLVVNISHQGMQDEVNENVYADLRSSKMIEFYGNDLSSNCSLTYSEDDKTDAFFEPKSDNRNYSQDSKEAKYKEKQTPKLNFQEKVYGNSEKNGQYSVLSLRRNVNPSEMEKFSRKQSFRRQFSENDKDSYCIMNVFETDNQQNEGACKSDSDVNLTSEPYSIAMRKYVESELLEEM